MMTLDCIDVFKTHFPFWEHLSPDEKEKLLNNTTLVSYKKGENIHSGSDDCVGILLVKHGQLRTYLLSEDGRDVTLYRLFSGEVCILSASCVLDAITFDVFIDAEEDTELLIISASIFRELSNKNIYVKCFGYEVATNRFSDVMWAMQQILFMRVDKRLAIFLYDEIAKNNSNEVNLTHAEIARYMGSAREVVTRLLKYFANEGIVSLSRGGVKILDKKKLKSLL